MKRILRAGGVLAGLTALAGGVHAGSSHEHGVARLDVATEPTRLTLFMRVPLDSVLGFEHAPRSDDERKQAALAVTRLRTSGALFRVDPAAQCTPGRVDLQSAALGLGAVTAGTEAAKDAHGDVEASYDFVCKDGRRAGFVEIGLFDFFPRLQRVEIQATTRRGQMKATLQRPVTRLPLAQ